MYMHSDLKKKMRLPWRVQPSNSNITVINIANSCDNTYRGRAILYVKCKIK